MRHRVPKTEQMVIEERMDDEHNFNLKLLQRTQQQAEFQQEFLRLGEKRKVEFDDFDTPACWYDIPRSYNKPEKTNGVTKNDECLKSWYVEM